MKCAFVNQKTGKKCQAFTMKNAKFCFFHNPFLEEEKRMARSKGGKGKKEFKLPKVPLESPQDVQKMLADLINSYRAGEISDKRATILQRLSDGMLKAMELSGLEKRISNLEDYIQRHP